MLEEYNINIPFELELEIIKRLPVESLIRFRSVSKVWKSLIDSPDFIADYSSKVQHLLFHDCHSVAYKNQKYVLIVDDHSFPQQKVFLTTPKLVKTLKLYHIIGSSRGLLCIHGYFPDYPFTEVAVLWNVSIRKLVSVVLPSSNRDLEDVGFGVCIKTNDPKIVFIRKKWRGSDPESITSCVPHLEVEIFTLGTGAWRSLYNNLPRKSVGILREQVVIDGFIIYWLAIDNTTFTMGDELRRSYLIVSFDITSEKFGEVNLPDTLARKHLHVSKLRKSLVVIECDKGVERDPTFFVWMMNEDGNSKSFTKLFSIYTPDFSIIGVLQFRKSGEPLVEIYERESYRDYDASLVVYEPYSKRIANHVIDGKNLVFSVFCYTETLLLHDQPNFVIYDKGKRFILKQKAAEYRRFSKHTSKKLNLWDRRS